MLNNISTSKIVLIGALIIGAWTGGYAAGTHKASDVLTVAYVERVQSSTLEQQHNCMNNFEILGLAYSAAVHDIATQKCPDIAKQIADETQKLK